MRWVKSSATSLESDTGHSVCKVRTSEGTQFEAWGPKGSGAAQMGHIEEATAKALEQYLGVKRAVQIRAVQQARRRIGSYKTGQEARQACEEDV